MYICASCLSTGNGHDTANDFRRLFVELTLEQYFFFRSKTAHATRAIPWRPPHKPAKQQSIQFSLFTRWLEPLKNSTTIFKRNNSFKIHFLRKKCTEREANNALLWNGSSSNILIAIQSNESLFSRWTQPERRNSLYFLYGPLLEKDNQKQTDHQLSRVSRLHLELSKIRTFTLLQQLFFKK